MNVPKPRHQHARTVDKRKAIAGKLREIAKKTAGLHPPSPSGGGWHSISDTNSNDALQCRAPLIGTAWRPRVELRTSVVVETAEDAKQPPLPTQTQNSKRTQAQSSCLDKAVLAQKLKKHMQVSDTVSTGVSSRTQPPRRGQGGAEVGARMYWKGPAPPPPPNPDRPAYAQPLSP